MMTDQTGFIDDPIIGHHPDIDLPGVITSIENTGPTTATIHP